MTAVAALVLVVARWNGRTIAASSAKVTASTGFLFVAYSADAMNAGTYGLLIVLGLLLGWLGDVFLLARRSKPLFLAGIISFLGGHIAYTCALVSVGVSWTLTATALAFLFAIGVAFYRWVGSTVELGLRRAVAAYIAVISCMLAAGVGTIGTPLATCIVPGAALFYASDIGVGLDRFKDVRPPAYLWSLPIYYAGQLLFAWSPAWLL